jgi:predicted PurR-regulated permease PerM
MRRTFVRGRSVGGGWQTGFWLACFATFAFLLWLFSAVLPPFVVALVLGYLLDPVVGRMQRFGVGRTWATTIILLGSIVVLCVTAVIIFPMLGRQLAGFIKAVPDLVNRAEALVTTANGELTHGFIGTILQKFGLDVSSGSDLKGQVGEIANKATQWLAGIANSILSRSAAILDILSWFVITPVVAFYLLVDWPRMIKTIDGLVPPRHRTTIWGLAHEIDLALSGFLRGQSLVCLFLAVWYGLGLSIIGLNFGLLIGLTGGLLSFIPYIGSLLVLVVSLVIAVFQGWPNWHLPAMTLGVVLVGQFLEGNVLSPKLVGDKVGLHPVWLIFALLAFGSVFGFAGLIIAVPVAAAAGVLLRFATKRYRESPFYSGDAVPVPVLVADGPSERGAA